MIEVKYNPKEYELTVSGHALPKAKTKKPDIYCAGVSSPVQGLCILLKRADASGILKKDSLTLEGESGYAHIKCEPLEEYAPYIEDYFTFCATCLEAIAKTYSEYVSFVLVD